MALGGVREVDGAFAFVLAPRGRDERPYGGLSNATQRAPVSRATRGRRFRKENSDPLAPCRHTSAKSSGGAEAGEEDEDAEGSDGDRPRNSL